MKRKIQIFSVFIVVKLLLLSCSLVTPRAEDNQYKNKFHHLWSKNNDPVHATGNLPIALNSPMAHEGIVYVGHNSGRMMAYDLENGRKVWSVEEKGTHHGTPTAFKDQVIYGNVQGRVLSRHYITGKLKYSVDLGASVEAAGVVYRDRIFFHLRNHQIFCLDVETGKVLWAYKRSVPYTTTLQRASKPLLHNNKLYVGTADGNVLAFNMEDGVVLWESKITNGNKFIDVDTTPVLIGEKLLVGSLSGNLTLLSASTGQILRSFPYSVARSPVKIGDNFLFGTTNGELILTDVEMNELKRLEISHSAISSIIRWKGHFAISNVNGELFLVDEKKFTVLDFLQLGHVSSAVFGEMVVQAGKLVVLSSRNRLYIFN